MSHQPTLVDPRPVVAVSRCLGFCHCRYNGQTIADPFVERLKPHVDFVTVCPEVAIGLGVPRDPIRIVRVDGQHRLMQPATSRDVTETMEAYAASFLDSLDVVDGFLLKDRSPSCGLRDVRVYQGAASGPSVGRAHGFLGRAVVERHPGLAIETEGRLNSYRLRDHYYTQLFTLARLRQAVAVGTLAALTQFHARQKYLFMAYHQTRLREMGRLLANRDGMPVSQIASAYRALVEAALAKPASCRAQINVLMHVMGYFKNELSPQEKAYFLDRIASYRAGRTPLHSLKDILQAWNVRFGNSYLAEQIYFGPYPAALVEATDSGKENACLAEPKERDA